MLTQSELKEGPAIYCWCRESNSIEHDNINGRRDEDITRELTTSHPITRHIELLQLASGKPFGRVLDAGTGRKSLDWIRHLLVASNSSSSNNNNTEAFGITGWTAVTTCKYMARLMQDVTKEHGMLNHSKPAAAVSSSEGVVSGNWFDDEGSAPPLLEGEMYDTILVDYLIGAIEGSSAYKQDCIFERLRKHLKPGGRMYVIGLQPIPDKAPGNEDLICQAKRLRDASVILAGDHCYRGMTVIFLYGVIFYIISHYLFLAKEYPFDWVLRTMERSSSLRVLEHAKFPLLHSESDIQAQLHLARNHVNKMASASNYKNLGGCEALAFVLEEQIAALERKIKLVMSKTPGHYVLIIW